MKLRVFKAVGTTLYFGLRHFPAFYLLCLLANLPSILYSVASGEPLGVRQDGGSWTNDMLTCLEIVLGAVVTAVMVWTLMRDRRGESLTVFGAFGDIIEHLPTILGVGAIFAAASVISSLAIEILQMLQPMLLIVPSIIVLIASLIFALVLPCAAVDNNGIADCFNRSIMLTGGSRIRIFFAFVLLCIPLGIVAGIGFAIAQPDLSTGVLPQKLVIFGTPLLQVFSLAAPVAIHEQLAELDDGMEFAETAAVFD